MDGVIKQKSVCKFLMSNELCNVFGIWGLFNGWKCCESDRGGSREAQES